MALHISGYRAGFSTGFTSLTRFDETEDNSGIGFGVLKLALGDVDERQTDTEIAWLLMDGKVKFEVEGQKPATFERHSLFDENPTAVHVHSGLKVIITADSDAELSVHTVANTREFPVSIYHPDDVASDLFGKGEGGGTCERVVRTIFDRSDENSELVLGEVVNPPGRWSSYPPHSHPEAEIYHYRFDKPQGFGFGQQGVDKAIQIRHCDTYKIINGIVHSQAAAPGYAMWYSWTIHNPPGRNWEREFDPEHDWTRD